ncbi:MAG: DEAD/DEAH box helicase [Rhodopseudomonas palustris]|nr:DEAD/DEAH box helicase [Rhodopseudomonas palustris]
MLVLSADPRTGGARSTTASHAYGRHLRLRPRRRLRRRRRWSSRSQALSRGVDVLVATPGRLLDLMQQGTASAWTQVEIFVLDEADRMLDMGFIHDIQQDHRQAARPSARPLFFSATMPSRRSATLAAHHAARRRCA